jgi:AcrR family transcriptional regulator
MSQGPRPPAEDLTARARIRDAAIRRFARDGIAATNLKSIAADAGVSAPLVNHHYGSKEGLQHECDRHVAALFRDQKRRHASAGHPGDPLAALREAHADLPVLRYLARTLAEGSRHAGELVDELVEDAIEHMAEGVASGFVKPSDQPRERAVVLVLWQLGALMLHEHAARLIGADLADGTEGTIRWWVPATEILAKGVIDESVYTTLRAAVDERSDDG